MHNPSILITEDNRLVAEDLKEILGEVGYRNVFYAKNVTDAINILDTNSIELVLLDINLNSDKTGIDLANHINSNYNTPFIYTTSYSDSDTISEVKKTNPAGFIIKPYNKEIIVATIEIVLFNDSERIKNNNPKIENPQEEKGVVANDYFAIKSNGILIKMPLNDILWLVSDKNYIEIITINKKYIIRSSLKQVLKELPEEYFVKCHKQYIINIKHIEGIKGDEIEIQNQKIPLSRNLRSDVLSKINS